MSNVQHMIARRERLLGPSMELFYDEPVHLVRGEGVWLFDESGRRYLDCYNNVPHVGHCHPHVVEAIAKQAAILNTHTRYLHNGVLDYVERLLATFHNELTTALLVCTGSEANDVALRMAQTATGATGVICTDRGYHGNTAAVSHLNYDKRPIGGYADWVRHVPTPDSYRPPGDGKSLADAFTASVEKAIQSLQQAGHGVSALLVCPYFANEGFPDVPAGFLDRAVAAVRQAGGLLIADEVQPGFGRLGSHMWGHERTGVRPEIVTVGKPMANGHPVGGVIGSAEIMALFRNAFGYFNTFAGNPVSCAAAMAVLDVMECENLMASADEVGRYAEQQLGVLAAKHDLVGEVRGSGLFFGLELVSNREDKTPAPKVTHHIVNAMRNRGVLLGSTGIHNNVLKVRPPMPFSKENADQLVSTLGEVLAGL